MFKKILVGIDPSELSTKALRVAANFARTYDSELYVFHAVHHHYTTPILLTPLTLYSTTHVTSAAEMDPAALRVNDEQLIHRIIADARDYVSQLNFGIESRTHFYGELDVAPAEYAVNFAKKNDIDLIVLGCRGHHSRLRIGLLGTVATKISNEAPCPVLIVR